VRELENCVERALIFVGDRPVGIDDLPSDISKKTPVPASAFDLRTATRSFERQHITKVLSTLGNNKAATAEALGIGLSSLYRKMDELGISKVPSESVASA
jgi:two-component system NtrC family response regulator